MSKNKSEIVEEEQLSREEFFNTLSPIISNISELERIRAMILEQASIEAITWLRDYHDNDTILIADYLVSHEVGPHNGSFVPRSTGRFES